MKELEPNLAMRKAAAERLLEYGTRLREPDGTGYTESDLESELKAARAELRARRRGASE